jgi:hypothetical protein
MILSYFDKSNLKEPFVNLNFNENKQLRKIKIKINFSHKYNFHLRMEFPDQFKYLEFIKLEIEKIPLDSIL